MIEQKIWDGFSGILQALANALNTPIIHQNVHGTPPDDGMWFETRFFPDTNENYGLNSDGPTLHRGYLQVSCCIRPGQGLNVILETAGYVCTYFRKGTTFPIPTNLKARVNEQPSITSVLVAAERCSAVVIIPYICFITNPNVA